MPAHGRARCPPRRGPGTCWSRVPGRGERGRARGGTAPARGRPGATRDGRLDEAEESLQQAMRLDPASPFPHYALGRASWTGSASRGGPGLRPLSRGASLPPRRRPRGPRAPSRTDRPARSRSSGPPWPSSSDTAEEERHPRAGDERLATPDPGPERAGGGRPGAEDRRAQRLRRIPTVSRRTRAGPRQGALQPAPSRRPSASSAPPSRPTPATATPTTTSRSSCCRRAGSRTPSAR